MNQETTPKTEREAGVGSSALFGLWGRKGWRYRLLHWLCARWGYFPIPWDAVENTEHDARCAADEATADSTMTNRAAAGHALLNRISAECRELITWRAGRAEWKRPNKDSATDSL